MEGGGALLWPHQQVERYAGLLAYRCCCCCCWALEGVVLGEGPAIVSWIRRFSEANRSSRKSRSSLPHHHSRGQGRVKMASSDGCR